MSADHGSPLSTAGPDDGGQGTRSGLGEASSGSAAKTKETPDA